MGRQTHRWQSDGDGAYPAAINGTLPAIDKVDKDVVICDWQYEKAIPSSVYFAMKGFKVATSLFLDADVAIKEYHNTVNFRENSPKKLRDRFVRMVETDWGSVRDFMDDFANIKAGKAPGKSAAATFIGLFNEMKKGK